MSDTEQTLEELEVVEAVVEPSPKSAKTKKTKAPKTAEPETVTEVEDPVVEPEAQAAEPPSTSETELTAEAFISKFATSPKEFQRMLSALNSGKSVAVDLAAKKLIMDNHPFYKQGTSYLVKRYGPQVVVVNNLKRQK